MRTHDGVRRAEGTRGASTTRGGSHPAARGNAGIRRDVSACKEHRGQRLGGVAVLTAVIAVLCASTAATNCPFVEVTTTPLDFGRVYTGSVFSGIGTVVVTAPAGLNFSVAWGKGLHYSSGFRHMKRSGGADLIPYTLYRDAGCTVSLSDPGLGDTYPAGSSVAAMGTGRAQVIPIHGRLTVPVQAQPGMYLDSIVVTVLY